MSRAIHIFRTPDRFVAGTVGQPGNRTFYLQAVHADRVAGEASTVLRVVVELLNDEDIQQVIDRVKARASEKNMPPEMVDMVGAQWRNMIGWFVQYEEEKLRQAQDAKVKSGDNGSA